MRQKFLALFLILTLVNFSKAQDTQHDNGVGFLKLMDDYNEVWLKLNPVVATGRGDYRYSDLLYIDFTDTQREKLKQLLEQYLTGLKGVQRESLSAKHKVFYDVFHHSLTNNLEALNYPRNLIPFDQQFGLPSSMALLGSGKGIQPFKTVKDYDAWLKRAAVFTAWTDSAVVYFKKGMKAGMVLPKSLVEKMIPQMAALVSADPTKSRFFDPITNFPTDFPPEDKARLTTAYTKLISDVLNPSYQKLHDFLKNEYLPAARSTSGYGSLPGGKGMYNYYVRLFTTTALSPEQVYNIGVSEVARIQKEMGKVKAQIGYKGTLKELFEYMRTDPKFFPYKSEEEILSAYRSILQRIEPKLKTMFTQVPKTPFEIRQVEAFRAASTAPNYVAGSLENGRPGIFYLPIVKVSNTGVDESLFLHEAIPGHHFQISLARENTELPTLLRYMGVTAYTEGWGLYTESLGKELGLYTDPYQQLKALSWEIHRAIRLVTDVGLHAKGWTREQAIKYMMDNEAITEQFATSEIERYMANPGQALAYKIGELKIKELRSKYTKQLGAKFKLASFHDELLKDGPMPLDVLERKMDAWAAKQKKAI